MAISRHARPFLLLHREGRSAYAACEQIWNQWVQLVRSRVEHLNTVIKQHQMFKGEPHRGWMKNLACFVKVTLHATAVEIRKREERDGPRYAGYGWWPHQ